MTLRTLSPFRSFSFFQPSFHRRSWHILGKASSFKWFFYVNVKDFMLVRLHETGILKWYRCFCNALTSFFLEYHELLIEKYDQRYWNCFFFLFVGRFFPFPSFPVIIVHNANKWLDKYWPKDWNVHTNSLI